MTLYTQCNASFAVNSAHTSLSSKKASQSFMPSRYFRLPAAGSPPWMPPLTDYSNPLQFIPPQVICLQSIFGSYYVSFTSCILNSIQRRTLCFINIHLREPHCCSINPRDLKCSQPQYTWNLSFSLPSISLNKSSSNINRAKKGHRQASRRVVWWLFKRVRKIAKSDY